MTQKKKWVDWLYYCSIFFFFSHIHFSNHCPSDRLVSEGFHYLAPVLDNIIIIIIIIIIINNNNIIIIIIIIIGTLLIIIISSKLINSRSRHEYKAFLFNFEVPKLTIRIKYGTITTSRLLTPRWLWFLPLSNPNWIF